jgi:hypothetical protein
MQDEPALWPPAADLERLVTKSDGLFIYAATAVRYIGEGKGSPQKKLRTVLEQHQGVDALYRQVITDAQECENFSIVMGALMHLADTIRIEGLSQLLGLKTSDIRISLDRCHSVLFIPDDDTQPIRPYHASLQDFLTNKERSQSLFCVPSASHLRLMVGCVNDLTQACKTDSDPFLYSCSYWGHHASQILSDTSTAHAHSLLLHDVAEQIDLGWVKYWLIRLVSENLASTFQKGCQLLDVSGISISKLVPISNGFEVCGRCPSESESVQETRGYSVTSQGKV